MRVAAFLLGVCITSLASDFSALRWNYPAKKKGDYDLETSLSYTSITSHFSEVADGFDTQGIDPSFTLGAGARSLLNQNENFDAALWFRPELAFVRAAPAPMVGAEIGTTFLFLEKFEIDGGLGYHWQQTAKKEPFSSSHFSNSWYDLMVHGRIRIPRVTIGLDLSAIKFSNRTLATAEGLTTQAGWNSTYVASPHVVFSPLPFLSLLAGARFYALGSAAIASDEFAWHIPKRNLSVGTLGAVIRVSHAEISLKGSKLFGNYDETELYFQSPYLWKHFLLAKDSLTAELKWHF